MRMQLKTLFKNESELEEIVVSILEKKFGLICKRQVRIDEKIPDILAYDTSSDCLFGIEIKLKDWKKGIYQSFLNKNFVDYSYLCMPNNYFNLIQKRIRDDFDKTGVGFMEINVVNNNILFKKNPEKNNVKELRKEDIKSYILKDVIR